MEPLEPIEAAPPLRDPRQPPPVDPRRRDPRLKSNSIPPTSSTSSAFTAVTGMSEHSKPTSAHPSWPVGHGHHEMSGYPEGHGHAVSHSQSRDMGQGHLSYRGQGHGHQSQEQWQPLPVSSIPGHSFKGEVYSPCFSDENDSDSSQASAQGYFMQQQNMMNNRDPRKKPVVAKHNEAQIHVDPRQKPSDPRQKSSDPRFISRDPRSSHSRNQADTRQIPEEDEMYSPGGYNPAQVRQPDPRVKNKHPPVTEVRERKDTKIDLGAYKARQAEQKKIERAAKDVKNIVTSNKTVMSEKEKHSSINSKGGMGRGQSKEREIKQEPKLKDSFERDVKKKEEERERCEKRAEKSKTKPDVHGIGRSSKERERSPLQRSPKQYSANHSNDRPVSVDKSSTSVDRNSSSSSKDSSESKGSGRKSAEPKRAESKSPVLKSRKSDPGPLKKSSSKTSVADRRSNPKSSKSSDSIALKKQGAISESSSSHSERKTFKSESIKDVEKRSRSQDSDYGGKSKKIKLDPVSSESEDFGDEIIPKEKFMGETQIMEVDEYPDESDDMKGQIDEDIR